MASENDYRAEPAADAAQGPSSNAFTAVKLLAAAALFYSAGVTFAETYQHVSDRSNLHNTHDIEASFAVNDNNNNAYSYINWDGHGRRLSEAKISKENPPSYMKDLFADLKERTKLMEETPPAEVKYWFEYTGPLQVS